MPPIDWILLTAVSFVAALVQGATGFGFAIVAVPFYLIILGSLSAIQVSLNRCLIADKLQKDGGRTFSRYGLSVPSQTR